MINSPATSVTWEHWLDGDPDTASGGEPPWLETQRRDAIERVRRQGIPTSREEGWRYTSLKALAGQRFARRDRTAIGVSSRDIEPVLVPGLDAHRVVLVNGIFMPSLSVLDGLPDGVRVGSLREMLDSTPDILAGRLNRLAGAGGRLFSALNTAAMDDGFVLMLDRAVEVACPIEIVHLALGGDEPRLAQPRHLVVLEDGARATLIERYLSIGEPLYCTNSVLELTLERNAVLEHHRVQTESPNAFHLTGLYLSQAQSSHYVGHTLGLGAAWSRTDLMVRFAGQHAECDLKGLYLAGDRQLVDFHLDVDHQVPRCASREAFKGIVYGKGRAVFDGRIHVARDAQQTDAQLSNKNLLLSRAAEVDTKPQLEIFADDVKCSHGTTVGEIDPQAIFYLSSRGIPEAKARRMLCLGFAHEIIDGLRPKPLREYVAKEVSRRLDDVALSHEAERRN